MTINDIIAIASRYTREIAMVLLIIPVVSLFYGKLVARGKGNLSPHKYIFAVLIYMSSIPGIFSAVLTTYALFILRQNMLSINFVIYLLPIISMAATLAFISSGSDLDDIPGFERLVGLFVMLAATFALTLIILKTRIWIFFGGSIAHFFLIALFLFLLLKWGARTLFRRGSEKRNRPPNSPRV